MQLPAAKAELNDAGYSFSKKALCRKCQARIEFWRTPKGTLIPLNIGTVVPHWSTCPYANETRAAERKGSSSTVRDV